MQCRNCLECIADGAKKCRYCGTYQGYWQKIISASKLIALASGFSAFVILISPIVREQLGQFDSEIDYSYIDQTQTSISFFIRNTGEKAGTIGPFFLPLANEIKLRPAGREGEVIMLEAGESIVVNLVPAIEASPSAVEKLAERYKASANKIRKAMNVYQLSEESFSESYYLYSRLGDEPSKYLDKVDSSTNLFGCMLYAPTLSFQGESRNAYLLASAHDEVNGACDSFVYSIYSTSAWRSFRMILEVLEQGDG